MGTLERDVTRCLGDEAGATFVVRELVAHLGEEAADLTLREAAAAFRSHIDKEAVEDYVRLGLSPDEAADRWRREQESLQAEANEIAARAQVVGRDRALREYWSETLPRPTTRAREFGTEPDVTATHARQGAAPGHSHGKRLAVARRPLIAKGRRP